MKRKAFYCDSQANYVVCNAPCQCEEKCTEYKAEIITGVKNRLLKDEDENVIIIKTGFIRGMTMITIPRIES